MAAAVVKNHAQEQGRCRRERRLSHPSNHPGVSPREKGYRKDGYN